MATEYTEEHGIKNIHVGCAVRTGDNGNHHRAETQRTQSLILGNLRTYLLLFEMNASNLL